MKLTTLLSSAAALAAAASAFGLAFDVLPFALFTVAVGAFLVLMFAHDYARPVSRWEPAVVRVDAAIAADRAVQPLRLAA